VGKDQVPVGFSETICEDFKVNSQMLVIKAVTELFSKKVRSERRRAGRLQSAATSHATPLNLRFEAESEHFIPRHILNLCIPCELSIFLKKISKFLTFDPIY
jgi:hypothetical protein